MIVDVKKIKWLIENFRMIDVAYHSGVTKQFLQKYYNGEREVESISIRNALKLMKAVEIAESGNMFPVEKKKNVDSQIRKELISQFGKTEDKLDNKHIKTAYEYLLKGEDLSDYVKKYLLKNLCEYEGNVYWLTVTGFAQRTRYIISDFNKEEKEWYIRSGKEMDMALGAVRK